MADDTPILNTISKFSLGGDVLNVIWYIAIGIIVVGLLGTAIYFMWKNKQFKYTVHVLEELGDGGNRIYHDKGRIIKRPDGTRIFKLKFFKDTCLPIPELDAMMIGKGGKKEVFLKKFGINEFDFIPLGIHLKALSIDIEPFPQGRKNWISTELKRSMQRHGTFWDKYGQMIITFGVLTLAFVMVIVIFKMASEIASSIADAASTLANAVSSSSCTVATPQPPTPGF